MSQPITKMETIQSVERAFQILEAVSREGSISIGDLHKLLNFNKASLSRLVFTMVESGYLTKNVNTGDYSLTLKPYEVGINAVQNLDKISLINSTLVELSEQTNRIAQFSIEDNNQLLCIQSIGQKNEPFSVYTNVGKRSPLYCTSAGKAILSTYSNTQLIEKWALFDVKQLTNHTIIDISVFLQHMSTIRQHQFALDMEENEYHVFCIGAAIMDHTNLPIGAISLTGNSLTPEEQQHVSELLVPAARRLSNLLGFVG